MVVLHTDHPGLDKLIHKKTVDSTNREVYHRRVEFTSQNILLVSDEQTAGKGQQDRHWESTSGLGLWMSLYLGRPAVLKHDLQLLSLYAGIVLFNVISELIPVSVHLKWPNDIMIKSRKCGGVLTQIQWAGNQAVSAILGIGMNLFHQPIDFSEAIRSSATSLQNEGWMRADRQVFLDRFLQEFFQHLDLLDQPDELIQIWNSHAFMLNQSIEWQVGDQYYTGTFLGITRRGEAQVLVGDSIQIFHSGEIRLVKPDSTVF